MHTVDILSTSIMYECEPLSPLGLSAYEPGRECAWAHMGLRPHGRGPTGVWAHMRLRPHASYPCPYKSATMSFTELSMCLHLLAKT